MDATLYSHLEILLRQTFLFPFSNATTVSEEKKKDEKMDKLWLLLPSRHAFPWLMRTDFLFFFFRSRLFYFSFLETKHKSSQHSRAGINPRQYRRRRQDKSMTPSGRRRALRDDDDDPCFSPREETWWMRHGNNIVLLPKKEGHVQGGRTVLFATRLHVHHSPRWFSSVL